MAYKILWDPKALDALRKLEREIAKRIVLKVGLASESPHTFLARLIGDRSYKLRVGDYRIIIDIDDFKQEMFVRLVGHRSNVYKIMSRR